MSRAACGSVTTLTISKVVGFGSGNSARDSAAALASSDPSNASRTLMAVAPVHSRCRSSLSRNSRGCGHRPLTRVARLPRFIVPSPPGDRWVIVVAVIVRIGGGRVAEHEPVEGRINVMALAAFVLVWLALVTTASAQAGRDALEPGRQVFFAQGCYGCHRLGVAG